MAITNLGAVGISAGGAYNPETVYKKYKVVSANGGSYMYINPMPAAGVPVTDTSHWQQIASIGGQDILNAVTAEKNAAIAAKVLAEGYAAQLAAGTASPAGTYANLAALNSGTPTSPNTSKIYITLDDGKWCYHNGSAWVAGGVYQAASVAADIADLDASVFTKHVYDYSALSEMTVGYIDTEGNDIASAGVLRSGYLSTLGLTRLEYKLTAQMTMACISFYDEDNVFLPDYAVISDSTPAWNNQYNVSGEIDSIPSDAKYFRISVISADGSGNYNSQELTAFYDNVKINKMLIDIANTALSEFNENVLLEYAEVDASSAHGRLTDDGIFVETDACRTTEYIKVANGDTIEYQLASEGAVINIGFFDQRNNLVRFIKASEGSSWGTPYPSTGKNVVQSGEYFIRVVMFHHTNEHYQNQYVKITRNKFKSLINDVVAASNNSGYRMLVLGDSYSRMGYWIESMMEIIELDDLVNLSVVGATIKDQKADRATYPYTSRPTSSGSNNQNTLASQIQKLKRLIAGTDLDSGETQIYENEDEYPNIIIIEGGMNDSPDGDATVDTYKAQFLSQVNGVHVKKAGVTTIGTVYIHTDIDAVNRTCFAGAYRYIAEELLTMFPNAQIFITTASHMNYFASDPNDIYGKIAAQQRMCADILSAVVIDWHAEGALNTVLVHLKGSGTELDPYTSDGGNEYTTDLLHPNRVGAKRYGRLAAKVIQQKFLGI